MEFKRQLKLDELIAGQGNRLIKIITGIRRCGKSYLLNRIFADYLVKSGVDESHIIKFSFDSDDDVDLLDGYFEDLPTRVHVEGTREQFVINSKKFRAYVKERTSGAGKYYLLLDEVQNLENFEGTLNGFLSHENYDVYVTGSNSKFLSSDVATEFRGRGDVIRLQPLSFKEIYDEVGGDRRDLLDSYLRYGGLPLCVLEENDAKKESYLKTVFKTIYLKDVKDRNRVKNEIQLEELTSVVASCVGTLVSPEKLMRTFRTVENTNIGANTVKRYLSYFEEAFIAEGAKRYDVKGRRYISSTLKYYFSDLGIRNAAIDFRQYEITHLMENAIYNELRNRGYNVDVGVIEKNAKNASGAYSKTQLEVDFVANKGSRRIYVQSAYSIEDSQKREQEEKSLNSVGDSFKKVIIIYDSCKPYYNDKGYLVIGLLDFLLDVNSLQY